jgi:hypothetical protein
MALDAQNIKVHSTRMRVHCVLMRVQPTPLAARTNRQAARSQQRLNYFAAATKLAGSFHLFSLIPWIAAVSPFGKVIA